MNRQKLDIYVPMEGIRNNILIIFFYGGSWDSGNKEKYKFVASSLTEQGYTVAIPDYRIYPEVIFPDFMQDAALSIAWLQKDGKNLQHVEHTFLAGHSAGAQIAGLLATDDQYLENANADIQALDGFIGLAGPYNFLPLSSKRLKEIFPENDRDNSQPINFVDGDEMPFLLLHGLKDKTVLPRNTETIADKINSMRGRVTVKYYSDVGHVEIIKPFVRGFENSVPTIQDINKFIKTTIKKEN
ncbi:MAG: alpha/beta hydrolase [Pseudomonadota bacterium]